MTKTRGLPIVLSAPSGGGKSTIAEGVLKRLSFVTRSISCTTRAPRGNEKNGVDYHFISESEFKERIEGNRFLEWARVHDHYYGTPLDALTEQLDKGKDVLLVIDPQGAVAVRKIYPSGIYIFVVPPTWEELKKRLGDRGTDDAKTKTVRLENAKKELTYLLQYDYLIVNEKLDEAIRRVEAILHAEHAKVSRLIPPKSRFLGSFFGIKL